MSGSASEVDFACDIAIIGAGIAGVSLAAELAPHARVAIVEAETVPAYHATGRSAAFWSESYGGPGVHPLTLASRATLQQGGWLTPRGQLWIATEARRHQLEDLARLHPDLVGQDQADLKQRVPALAAQWTCGLWEAACCDIDVAGFHADCLARFHAHGGRLILDRGVVGLVREAIRGQSGWTIALNGKGRGRSAVAVNAAGAWADAVASLGGARTLGLQPMRRTVAQVRTDPTNPGRTPLVIDAAGQFYFKSEGAGRLWICPHDETPVPPQDVAADEWDVATAVARVEAATLWAIPQVERKWAGLRTFAPDRLPVYGFDRDVPGFFWCAGQGGFGIQTAPAAARMAAAMILGRAPGEDERRLGIDPDRYRPDRFMRGHDEFDLSDPG